MSTDRMGEIDAEIGQLLQSQRKNDARTNDPPSTFQAQEERFRQQLYASGMHNRAQYQHSAASGTDHEQQEKGSVIPWWLQAEGGESRMSPHMETVSTQINPQGDALTSRAEIFEGSTRASAPVLQGRRESGRPDATLLSRENLDRLWREGRRRSNDSYEQTTNVVRDYPPPLPKPFSAGYFSLVKFPPLQLFVPAKQKLDSPDIPVKLTELENGSRRFAEIEKARVDARRASEKKIQRERKIAELKSFSKTFKLDTPVPKDLLHNSPTDTNADIGMDSTRRKFQMDEILTMEALSHELTLLRGTDSKCDKLPKDFMPQFLDCVQHIMETDIYPDPMVRKSFEEAYHALTVPETMKRLQSERRVDELFLIFYSSAYMTLLKHQLPTSYGENTIYLHTASCIKLIIRVLADCGDYRGRSEMMSRLKSFEDKLLNQFEDRLVSNGLENDKHSAALARLQDAFHDQRLMEETLRDDSFVWRHPLPWTTEDGDFSAQLKKGSELLRQPRPKSDSQAVVFSAVAKQQRELHTERPPTDSLYGTATTTETKTSTSKSKITIGTLSTAPSSITKDTNPSSRGEKRRYVNTELQPRNAQLLLIPEDEQEQDKGSLAPQAHSEGQSSLSRLTEMDVKKSRAIARKFVQAIRGALRFTNSPREQGSQIDFQMLPDLLKQYSEEVAMGVGKGPRRQAVKRIRLLRFRISSCFEQEHNATPAETMKIRRTFVEIARGTLPENPSSVSKVNAWDIAPPSPEKYCWKPDMDELCATDLDTVRQMAKSIGSGSHPASISDFVSDSEGEEVIHLTPREDEEIFEFLTSHSAFKRLLDEIQDMVDRQHGNLMNTIQRRVLSGLEQPESGGSGGFQSHAAMLRLDLDIVAFLSDNYDLKLTQDIGSILTITGEVSNAYMSTVRDYLRMSWPEQPFSLLEALQEAVVNYPQDENNGIVLSCAPNRKIIVNLLSKTIFVTGSTSFIVNIAQQAAWLVSVCRVSGDFLEYSAASVKVATPDFDPRLHVFQISSEVSPSPTADQGSCWNEIVGKTVIAYGFPIPPREHGERGLEIPLEIMAALGRVPLATTFDGGIILKGRSVAFLPVARTGNSVQWHFVKKIGARITYREATALCPTSRLKIEVLNEDDVNLPTTRTFLGWCPETINLIGTEYAKYSEIGNSDTWPRPKKFGALTGFAPGFSMIGTGSLPFTFSNHNTSYKATPSEYYDETLDDAKQIPVILYDMNQRRAWQTDGERIILHIILHQHELKPNFVDDKKVVFQIADCNSPSSVRLAMTSNADVVVAIDRRKGKKGPTSKYFQDLVHDLYARFEGMHEVMAKEADGIEVKFECRKRVNGFEYMDLVRKKREMFVKQAKVVKTAGNWPDYGRDLGALVLFGTDFGDLIKPFNASVLCAATKLVLRGKDYLAVEVEKLQSLYTENGSEKSQRKVTPHGISWHRSPQLFDACVKHDSGVDTCGCDRTQQFLPKRFLGKANLPGPLKFGIRGAVIFGQATDPFPWLSKNGEKLSDPICNRAMNNQEVNEDDNSSMASEEFEELVSIMIDESLPDARLRTFDSLPRVASEASGTTISSTEMSSRTAKGYLTPATSHGGESGDENTTRHGLEHAFSPRILVPASKPCQIKSLLRDKSTNHVPIAVPVRQNLQSSPHRQQSNDENDEREILSFVAPVRIDIGKGVDRTLHSLHDPPQPLLNELEAAIQANQVRTKLSTERRKAFVPSTNLLDTTIPKQIASSPPIHQPMTYAQKASPLSRRATAAHPTPIASRPPDKDTACLNKAISPPNKIRLLPKQVSSSIITAQNMPSDVQSVQENSVVRPNNSWNSARTSQSLLQFGSSQVTSTDQSVLRLERQMVRKLRHTKTFCRETTPWQDETGT